MQTKLSYIKINYPFVMVSLLKALYVYNKTAHS